MTQRDPSTSASRLTFPLGEVVATPAALEVLERMNINPWQLLNRHRQCDWGDLCAEDRRCNDEALVSGARLFSAYVVTPGSGDLTGAEPERLWIITEATDDAGVRNSTCILTPGCY